VPQVLPEHALGQQLADVADALVAWPFELREQQVRVPVCPVQLLRAAARVVLRLECGQDTLDLFEAHSIGSRISARRRGDLDLAVRNHLGDDRCDIADAIIVLRLPNIEGLVPDRRLGCLQGGDERP